MLASGVYGIAGPDEAREVAAEDLVSCGKADRMLVQALMDPQRLAPAFTLQDALDIYVKEKLGGSAGPEHRGTIVRLDCVIRHAEEVGLRAKTAFKVVSSTRSATIARFAFARCFLRSFIRTRKNGLG